MSSFRPLPNTHRASFGATSFFVSNANKVASCFIVACRQAIDFVEPWPSPKRSTSTVVSEPVEGEYTVDVIQFNIPPSQMHQDPTFRRRHVHSSRPACGRAEPLADCLFNKLF